ncbi:MAG: hypothetical protein FJ214_03495 [Ignavibacteria bacterium]|nr:hypothetical protein [Ignavibacteria bacterium]
MKKNFLLILTILTITTALSFAQETFKLSAQVRPRFEFDKKGFNNNFKAKTYTSLRTRLGVSFMPLKDVSGFIQVQDSRVFGEVANTLSNFKNVDLHQAYFKIENLFALPIDLKIGRMELAYGPERLIGAVNWSNVGRSFEGAVLTINGEKFKADIFDLQEFERFNYGDSLDQQILGIYTDLVLIKAYKIQPFIIWQRGVPTDLLNRFTLGFYVKGDLDQLTHETEFAYQLGEITSSGIKQDVNAYMFAFNANYNFESTAQPSLGVGIDYISGDETPTDKKYKSFNTLYATGHKYFGYMDYFINLPIDTYGLGVTDLIGRFSISPVEKLRASAHFHIFLANGNYKLKTGSTSKEFGSELDLLLNYKYNSNVTFEGGFSFFSPGEIFKERRGKDIATWVYLMAVVNL